MKKIEIWGEYEIINGKTHIRAKNKFLPHMAVGFGNLFMVKKTSDYTQTLFANSWTMKLGSDTNTPTTSDLTDLVNQFTQLPDSKTGSFSQGDGEATIVLTATWNAGNISGQVGEIGIYTKSKFFDTAQPYEKTDFDARYLLDNYILLSRTSVADGEFNAFTIDTNNPLTVNYIIHIATAPNP